MSRCAVITSHYAEHAAALSTWFLTQCCRSLTATRGEVVFSRKKFFPYLFIYFYLFIIYFFIYFFFFLSSVFCIVLCVQILLSTTVEHAAALCGANALLWRGSLRCGNHLLMQFWILYSLCAVFCILDPLINPSGTCNSRGYMLWRNSLSCWNQTPVDAVPDLVFCMLYSLFSGSSYQPLHLSLLPKLAVCAYICICSYVEDLPSPLKKNQNLWTFPCTLWSLTLYKKDGQLLLIPQCVPAGFGDQIVFCRSSDQTLHLGLFLYLRCVCTFASAVALKIHRVPERKRILRFIRWWLW